MKTNISRIMAIAAIAALMPLASAAQETETITGKITTLKRFPVQNMKVTSSASGESASTNADGIFKIAVSDKDVLKVECEPFKPVSQKIRLGKYKGDTLRIELVFPRKPLMLNKIMDDGYLDSKYEVDAFSELTFQKDYSKYTDIDQAIAVEFPSLRMVYSGCYQLPGNTDVNGDGCMLTVVGNSVSDITEIPTTNIEDIILLKGAQATVWGVQGANGVLVVKIKNTDDEIIKRE